MNKSVCTAFLSFSIALVLMFSQSAEAQRKRRSLPKKVSAVSLSAQAEVQARAFWASRLSKCGDDYYTRDSIYVHQFKNLNIQVTAGAVSGADRLNGIEYLASTVLTVGQSRTYSHKSTAYQGIGWSRWSDGFTTAMGGVGLMASVRRQNGRWLVIPNSISQAGVLKQIGCADAANPAALYQRLEEESYSAEVRKFREKAQSMGIYAHNIPSEMWTAMYNCGGLYDYYTTVGWVYLAPNGGWGASGRKGYASGNLLSGEDWQKVNGDWIEQVTKDGGYILLWRGQEQYGRLKRGFTTNGIPDDLLKQMWTYHNQGFWIKKVRIGYNGEWFLMAYDQSGHEYWGWNNVSESAAKVLTAIGEEYDKKRSNDRVSDVAFLPNGGYVIVSGRNTYYAENVPAEPAGILKMLRDGNYEISQLTFGPDDSWIIRANGPW